MSRTTAVALIAGIVVIVVLLVTVNVTRCETFSGPLGWFRLTACEEAPLINPD